jgi:signal transduction histidine kinase
MKERVRQLGGTLTIGSAQPAGVIVQALIPADGQTTLAESARADPVD